MAQIALVETHEVVPIAPDAESLLVPVESLVMALLIFGQTDREGSAHRNVVALAAPSLPAGIPTLSSERELGAEYSLAVPNWFCAARTISSQIFPKSEFP
mgnify:CR=1 FL=1